MFTSNPSYKTITFDKTNKNQAVNKIKDPIWEIGSCFNVEFFEDEYVPLRYISIEDPKLQEYLSEIPIDSPVALDLEWTPDMQSSDMHLPALYQICSSNGILVIKTTKCTKMVDALSKFLLSTKLNGKGTGNDQRKLVLVLQTTNFILEDIEKTILRPQKLPLNFEKMVNQIIGEPCVNFKSKDITWTDWEKSNLTPSEVLYSAFDALVVYKVYKLKKI